MSCLFYDSEDLNLGLLVTMYIQYELSKYQNNTLLVFFLGII